MKHNPDTLALAMDYAAAMEACAAYVAVKNPAVRDPETAYRLLRPIMTAATSGDAQEAFFVLLLDTKNKVIGSPVECLRACSTPAPYIPARSCARRSGRARQASFWPTTTPAATRPPARRIATSPAAWSKPPAFSASASLTM